MKTLVLYSSSLGQTLKITQRIVQQMDKSERVEYVDLSDKGSWCDPSTYQRVLIGASVHFGKFKPELYRYIDTYKETLNKSKCAFFMICLTARKPEKCDPQTNLYMKKFRKLCVWDPKIVGIFAGELAYTRYNWWQKRVIQLIMRMTGGSTDTKTDIEFTNWNKVDEFAKQFNSL